jgi:glycosyltransferase involved in cell wall biosynthesis
MVNPAFAPPSDRSLEEVVAKLARELSDLQTRHSRLESEVLALRRRSTLEFWVRRLLGVRLGVYDQYAPRVLSIPAHYHRKPALRAPLPKVSIVTPAFNHGRYLERTLRSVLDQDYPRLQYVVQDGGSGDETLEILMRYRDRLDHVASGSDRGQTHALNLGFDRTDGDIFAYLNSDDMLLPGAISYVVAYFQNHPEVDVVYGHRIFVDVQDAEVGRWVLPPHSDTMLHWADYVPQETLFWRRGIWDRVGRCFDETYQFAMDWELLLRFQKAGAKMVRLPRFLGAFRVHDVQKSQALLATVGASEMERLRSWIHGRPVARSDIRRAILGYLIRHAWYQRVFEWGLLRY